MFIVSDRRWNASVGVSIFNAQARIWLGKPGKVCSNRSLEKRKNENDNHLHSPLLILVDVMSQFGGKAHVLIQHHFHKAKRDSLKHISAKVWDSRAITKITCAANLGQPPRCAIHQGHEERERGSLRKSPSIKEIRTILGILTLPPRSWQSLHWPVALSNFEPTPTMRTSFKVSTINAELEGAEQTNYTLSEQFFPPPSPKKTRKNEAT